MTTDSLDTFDSTGNASQVLSKELFKGEKILWAGQPEPTLFTGADIFLVPFTLLWGGGLTYGLIGSLSHGYSSSIPIVAYGVFAFLTIFGFYFVFGRFFFKLWKKKNTYYGVTNQRIMVVCMVPSKSIQAVFVNQLPAINQSVNSKGIGSLVFGNSSPRMMMYANTGLDFFGGYMNVAPAFFDIKDVDKVYQLINNVRNESSA